MTLRLLILMALLAGAVSCQRNAPAPTPDAARPIIATLNTNRVHLGDPVTLQLQVRHDPADRITWPDLNRDRSIVVRRNPPADSSQPGQTGKSWELTSLQIGTHAVATGSVVFTRADGSTTAILVPPLSLRVDSLLDGTNTTLRDIKDLARWPRAGLQSAFLMLGLVALAAVAVALLVLFWRRRAQRPALVRETPPHERALQALAELRARGWIGTGHVEPFYVELSAIARRYLEDRFRLRAPEQTTEEFIRAATTSRLLSVEHQQLVVAFLLQSDLVKFARHHPAAADMEAALAAAEQLVRETAPQPDTATPPPSGDAP